MRARGRAALCCGLESSGLLFRRFEEAVTRAFGLSEFRLERFIPRERQPECEFGTAAFFADEREFATHAIDRRAAGLSVGSAAPGSRCRLDCRHRHRARQA